MNRMSNSLVHMSQAETTKISHEIELETLFNKNQTIARIKSEFTNCKEFNFTKYMESKNIDVDFGYDLLVQMVLHKRTTLPTLVGILRSHWGDMHAASQLAANELLKAAKADLVDWDPDLEIFIVKLDITRDVQEDLDRYQFPLPMIVEPAELKDNRSTPYVLVRDGSVILRKNHHDDDVCLDHINRVNKIKFTINNDTATMVRNKWRNLDKPKAGETKQDFERRKKAFEKYDRTAKQVMAKVTQLGNEFYLTHKIDKRGRTYCQGYHITYQGNAWAKAVVELADKELVE